jgi:hypothetical protein
MGLETEEINIYESVRVITELKLRSWMLRESKQAIPQKVFFNAI